MSATSATVASAPFDRRLLGGLSPTMFLARHWQRKPLLVRGAVDDVGSLPGRADLFALAARDDVESRLVSTRDDRWSLRHGPIRRAPRARRDWTLLVQGVNLIDRDADALMRRFDFVSTMRLDDLMMSYAADGGGVGAHLDSYDVFLLQVSGRRRWRWQERPASTARERALVDDVPVKLLRHFAPTHEAVLEPGDLLYLPPSCAHEGVAVGPCITASIGFRVPSWNDLTQEFLFAMAERDRPDGRYSDAGRSAARAPGAIDPAMLRAIGERLTRLHFSGRDVAQFVGRYFTDPKAHVTFDPPAGTSIAVFAKRAAAVGLALDLRATMLYRGRDVFIAGDTYRASAQSMPALRRLADRRRIDGATVATVLGQRDAAALLHEWWQHGWIRFDEEVSDDDA